MSRGGRGGAARGGLRGAAWEGYNATDEVDGTPIGDYPTHPDLKRPCPFTEDEERQFKHYKTLQTQIHRGPLYTQPTKRHSDMPVKTFSEDQYNKQYGTDRKADMDPFEGVETYSMRYLPPKNIIPKLSGRPFITKFFPEELLSTLEGKEGEKVRNGINQAMQRKGKNAGWSGANGDRKQALDDKLFGMGDDEDEEEKEKEGGGDVEDGDSEFEDEDLDNDYNAEQYFDDGEDGDDGDGDEGGGGDY